MEKVNLNDIDARSAALGGVAGLGIGGLVGWLAASHVSRRRLQAELVSLKDHYDARLARLQSQVSRFERTERLRRTEEAAILARAEKLIADQGYTAPGEDAGDWPGNPAGTPADDPDGDSERLPAVGLEGLEGIDGLYDDEPGEPGADPEEISEDPGPAGADFYPGSVTPDKSKPYVISEEAFGELADEGFETMSITYYIGDGVLIDDRDQNIPNILMTTGPLSRDSFGGISGDDRIMYVRNHKLEHDFEIVLHDGKWTDLMLNYGDNRGNQAK
jgi:hypothetical protein